MFGEPIVPGLQEVVTNIDENGTKMVFGDSLPVLNVWISKDNPEVTELLWAWKVDGKKLVAHMVVTSPGYAERNEGGNMVPYPLKMHNE